MFAARLVGWDPPGGCWRSGEWFWIAGWDFWRVWRRFGTWLIFWSVEKAGVCCGFLGLWWMAGSDVRCSGKVVVW